MKDESAAGLEETLVLRVLAFHDVVLPQSTYRVEVRSHGRARADVMLFDGTTLVAVEAKISDWKRAIAQAVLNRFFADRSYIAIPNSKVGEQLLAEAKRHGVGVLGILDDNLVVRAKARTANPNDDLRERALTIFARVD